MEELQYEELFEQVEREISSEKLRLEIYDHICSCIEYLMNQGADFESAKQKAFFELAPKGLKQIEKETFILLTLTNSFIMKKLMYFCGFFATLFILTGFVFRMMHWPGPTAFMFTGNAFLLLTMIFSGTNLFMNRENLSAVQIAKSSIGIFSGILISAGTLFKIFHWPTASIQLLIGMSLLICIVVPTYFWQFYKRSVLAS
ncbi:MAG: hypothetical protein WED33_08120 [Bacteroidia bacterium]